MPQPCEYLITPCWHCDGNTQSSADARFFDQGRKPDDRTHPIRRRDGVEPPLIVRQQRAVALRMPQMQNPGGEVAILAADACAQEPDQEVGILQAPAIVACIESINSFNITTPDREIAGSRTAPCAGPQLAQRPERQPQQWCQPVDLS